MGKQKVNCKACNGKHERPVGARCAHKNSTLRDDVHAGGENGAGAATIEGNKLDRLLASLERFEDRLAVLEDEPRNDSAHEVTPQFVATITADTTVPTIQSLKTNQQIQLEVNKRLHDLQSTPMEAQGNNHRLKSGRFRGTETTVRKYIKWPNEYCYIGQNRKRLSYDDLNTQQFTLGFLRAIQDQPDVTTRSHMLNYAVRLFQDAVDVSFNVACLFAFVIR